MAQKATDEQVESHVERTGGDLPPGVESSREEDAGLSDLTPEGTEITMRGEKFYIQEMLAGQLLGISADIGEFGLSFQGIRADDAPLILAIITSRMDIVLKIAATMLEKDIAFVERAKASELVAFVAAFWKENESFFRQLWNLLPETYRNRTGADKAGEEQTATKPEEETPRSESAPLTETPPIGST
jgi:hypothetical protein